MNKQRAYRLVRLGNYIFVTWSIPADNSAVGIALAMKTLVTKGGTDVAKYGKKASKKVEKAMHERKKGTLKSGSGKRVTSKKQAIAIGLSEARKAGAKVPRKKSSSKKK